LRWQELGYGDLIQRIKKLVQAGRVELTGSLAYHPLTPLIPRPEAKRQIRENTDILKDNFGIDIKLTGFFLPEMAYSPEVGELLQAEGFSWLLLDEIAYNRQLNQADCSKKFRDKNSGLEIIFRSRSYSNSYVPELVEKELDQEDEAVIVTATDGELYGLRHNDPQGVLERVASDKRLRTRTVSEFLAEAEDGGEVEAHSCNWESAPEELAEEHPFASWLRRDNDLQQCIWDLAYTAYDTVEAYGRDDNYNWARWHLVRGLASCTFWWASAKDFAYIYGPYAWNPDEVERGVNELIRSIRSLEDPATRTIKLQAEQKYVKIKEILWNKHWEEFWKRGG